MHIPNHSCALSSTIPIYKMAKENSEESLRDIAFRIYSEEEQKKKLDANETHERSIIIVGSKGVGKTAMVHRFLEKDETLKPTIAIDYSFGRKAGKSLVKNVVHIWEVGYLASSMISAAMKGSAITHSPHHTTLLLMLDLSKPELLWSSFEDILSAARSALKMSYDEQLIEEMRQRRISQRKTKAEDIVNLFPMQMNIIGGKYDEFKEFDMDRKELVGKTLRAIAHCLGAGLYYHSLKEKALMKRTKELLAHYGFGTHAVDGKCTDHEKPLAIPPGADSFSLIDLQLPHSKPLAILDTIKQMYTTRIPASTKTNEPVSEDPSNDPNFSEPSIDRLRVQREEEISVLLHEMLEGRSPKVPIPDPF